MNKIFYQTKQNPWENLAIEEYLLQEIQPEDMFLFLWQNKNTIVIGKHQNPWIECKISALEIDNITLARRITGGGAVFHDLGNLNFSFIMDRKKFQLEKQLSVILEALKTLNIQAYFQGRNDLLIDLRKFSGNAFCYLPHATLHHGTILVSSNLDKLSQYLEVAPEKIHSKGIQSVRSRVCNLQDYNPSITIQQVIDAITLAFIKIYGISHIENLPDTHLYQNLYEKQSSWEWRFGKTPHFDWELQQYFSWGTINLGLQIQNAQIQTANIYSDAMDPNFIEILQSLFLHMPLHFPTIVQKIQQFPWEPTHMDMALDVAQWLQNKSS